MYRIYIYLLTALLLVTFGGLTMAEDKKLADGLYAKIQTDKGDILLELTYKQTPLTVINFAGLAEGKLVPGGEPFYDGLKFHRVINNFMIQGGCPLGTGTGGPGYTFPDEIHPSLKHDRPGVLSMANAGPDTNGSQFFITHVATPHLDGRHTVFGHVVEGQDVVNAIKQNDIINKVEIIRIGEEAKQFKTDQQAFDDALAQLKKQEQQGILDTIEEKWPGMKKTSSGLRYLVKKEGTGDPPRPGATVAVHYTGRLLENNRKFDSSHDRGEPIKFKVGTGQVIPGWDEALLSMNKGEKRVIVLPPDLAYGSSGAGRVIPPNAWLVFEVELVDY